MAKNVIINGVTYNDVPYVAIPQSGGGTASFYDTGDATAAASDVRAGVTFYKDGGKVNGSMVNAGDVSATISTKNGTVTIPSGLSDGGTVMIALTEQQKIIADNIRSGVTILGQSGSSSVVNTADATAAAAQILNGYSAYVNGAKINGSATVPSVSQDSTSKVLTIS